MNSQPDSQFFNILEVMNQNFQYYGHIFWKNLNGIISKFVFINKYQIFLNLLNLELQKS